MFPVVLVSTASFLSDSRLGYEIQPITLRKSYHVVCLQKDESTAVEILSRTTWKQNGAISCLSVVSQDLKSIWHFCYANKSNIAKFSWLLEALLSKFAKIQTSILYTDGYWLFDIKQRMTINLVLAWTNSHEQDKIEYGRWRSLCIFAWNCQRHEKLRQERPAYHSQGNVSRRKKLFDINYNYINISSGWVRMLDGNRTFRLSIMHQQKFSPKTLCW